MYVNYRTQAPAITALCDRLKKWWTQTTVLVRTVLFSMPSSGSEWLACWTQVQKGAGSNHSRDAVG